MIGINVYSLSKASLSALIIARLPTSLAAPANHHHPSGAIQHLQWGDCSHLKPLPNSLSYLFPLSSDRSSAISIPDAMQCSNLSVPLDWTKPEGDQISLALARLQAGNQSGKKGSLMINPGGPGGSAIQMLTLIASKDIPVSRAVLDSFDIVAMDPRGVAYSTPLNCNWTLMDETSVKFPEDQASLDRQVAQNRALGESCLKKTGDLVYHMDTTSAARDIEAVRLALDDGKLNWLGYSYGTMLGATYAELFPQNIRAMVLDAVVNHAQAATDAALVEGQNSEQCFNRFFDWCDNHPVLSLRTDNTSTAQAFDNLVSLADQGKFANVTGASIISKALGMLHFKEQWPKLARALSALAEDDNDALLGLKSDSDEPAGSSLPGVVCLEWLRASTNVSELLYESTMLSVLPHSKGYSGVVYYQLICVGWPAPIVNPPHPANIRDAPPILLINSLYDAATPHAWAEGLRTQIEGSVLLTRDGDGHTSYAAGARDSEVDKIVDAYLLDLIVPEDNLVVKS